MANIAKVRDNTVYCGDKVVGNIVNYRYITPRRKEHFYRKYGSFGIAKEILEALKEHNVLNIHFIYSKKEDGVPTTVIYKVDLDRFMDEGKAVKEAGYERQVHLPVSRMYKSKADLSETQFRLEAFEKKGGIDGKKDSKEEGKAKETKIQRA